MPEPALVQGVDATQIHRPLSLPEVHGSGFGAMVLGGERSGLALTGQPQNTRHVVSV